MIVTLALIQDTFREALARKIFWGLFGLSTLTIIFFLFLLNIDIVEGAIATVTLFGRQVNRVTNVDQWVRGTYAAVSGFIYTFGMFLSVFASAGLTPSILEPGRIELLLSKPVSRLHILLGRYVGNVLIISGNVIYLVIGVWVILGIKTGIWSVVFLSTIGTSILIFAVLLTVVVLVGVLFDSAALAIMVTVALMIISPILAQTTPMLKLLSSEWSRTVWQVLYYVLPKVYDLGRIPINLIRGIPVDVVMPIWTSAAFGVCTLALAIVVFEKRDF
jgi:ABC-2 type transport system permease protein